MTNDECHTLIKYFKYYYYRLWQMWDNWIDPPCKECGLKRS